MNRQKDIDRRKFIDNSLKKTGWARLNIPEKWIPHAEGKFNTSSGKCKLYNPDINPALPDYQAVPYSQEELSKYPFHLLAVKTTKKKFK